MADITSGQIQNCAAHRRLLRRHDEHHTPCGGAPGWWRRPRPCKKAARDAGILICYSATVFRPGYLEISDRNKNQSQRKASGQPAVGDPMQVIHPAVKPIEGEVVAGKHRTNALHGTDLDLVLRANDIHNLILLGYATSGVVLSTTRYAADLDYRLYIVEDCCA